MALRSVSLSPLSPNGSCVQALKQPSQKLALLLRPLSRIHWKSSSDMVGVLQSNVISKHFEVIIGAIHLCPINFPIQVFCFAL